MITSTGLSGMYAAAQSNSTSNISSTSITNATSSAPSPDLEAKMQQLINSNDLTDTATLAYIWGYPLVLAELTKDFTTSPNVPPAPGRGPINTINHSTKPANASFTDVVRPPVDFLLSFAWVNLKNGPLIMQIPDVTDRYFSVQFLDAYSNVLPYIGTRETDGKGGTYLIVGPNSTGTSQKEYPKNVTGMINFPTNLNWIIVRALFHGLDDVENVHKIQNDIKLTPLMQNLTSLSNEQGQVVPIEPLAANIPKLGVKFFDILSKSLIDNPPPNNESFILQKFETIGISAGNNVSHKSSTNETLEGILLTGISNGEMVIDNKIAGLGEIINGWITNYDIGKYGSDYLLRAAVAKAGYGSNTKEEAITPIAFVDGTGSPLTGENNNRYVIHFENGELPPVKPGGFWSFTVYDDKGFLVDNPLNRYVISEETEGLKTGDDGSLDIFLSPNNPGGDNQSNWLPIPTTKFNVALLIYIPEDQVLTGKYQVPPIEKVS